MSSIIFKTKDGRKILVSSPIYLTHENAKDIVDAKYGKGYFDRVVVQGNVDTDSDDEYPVKLNYL